MAPVIICSKILWENIDRPVDDVITHRELRNYVKIIREVAEYYSLPVLDLYAYSGLQPQIEEVRTMYMPDGVHPNDKGNEVIAHKLQKFLEAL